MGHKIKRKLKKLSNNQFAEDKKKNIKSPHEFYGKNVPELGTLARKLHEEHDLKKFYKVFNKLWKSGYQGETSLAIYTLQLYKEDFDLTTWKFLKTKLKDVKSWDKADIIGREVIGEILLKYPKLEKEIFKLSKGKNLWIRKMAILSTLPLIKKGNVNPALKISETYLYDKEENIQLAIGHVLSAAGKENPEETKKFILKHIQMPTFIFNIATKKMKDLRKVRKLKKLKSDKSRGFFFWRFR